jgi:hypothetical protein
MVDANNLLYGVSHIEVVHWGIIDHHVFIIHRRSIGRCSTFGSLTLCGSSFSGTTKFIKLWLIITDEISGPLTLILEIIDEFKLIKFGGCS